MPEIKISKISPGRILLVSLLFVIFTGAILLALPMSRVVDVSFIDILFTSVTSTCVTGLLTVPMSYFSFFGQCVILALIQIGGLGLMTLSIFMVSLVLNLSFTTKIFAGQILDFEFWGKIKNFLKMIIGFTIIIEAIGAFLLYISFSKILPSDKALFYAIFHSVSAFCNTGISLFEPGMFCVKQHWLTLSTMATLILFGGVGFIVWYEFGNNIIISIKNWWREEPKKMVTSLHTKVVLFMSSILVFSGAVLFYFLERTNSLKDLGLFDQIINAFFMSVATRTAGFDPICISRLGLPIIFIFLILMFIGASPSSTSGGIKVTTFTIFLATIIATIRNKDSVEIFGRNIPSEQIFKTSVIFSLSLTLVCFSTFLMLITDPQFSVIQIMFEVVSAFATVGFSTGITPFLSISGKLILSVLMIIGRLGALTLVLALRKTQEKQLYKYPDERVLLG